MSVVLFSGGMDSFLALLKTRQEDQVKEAIFIHYGQETALVEGKCSFQLCQRLGIPWKQLTVPLRGVVQSGLTGDSGVDEFHPQNSSLLKFFFPGRNALFLTLAAMRAYALGVDRVYSGICSTSVHAYPDCTQAFVQSQEDTLRRALDLPSLTFINPVMNLERWQVFQEAYDMDREGMQGSPEPYPGCAILNMMRFGTHTGYSSKRDHLHNWGYGPMPGVQLDPAQEKRAAAWWKFLQESGYEDEVKG